MAEQTILNVSLKTYRDEIKQLQNEMLNLTKGTDEYKKAAEEARKKQAKLKQVLDDTKYALDGDENSLNALRKQLSDMKKEAATMDIGSEKFKDASKAILDLNDKIKAAEESQGNFTRNVGNYTDSMTKAFNKVGLNIGNISPLFATLTNAVTEGSAKGVGALKSMGAAVKGFGTQLKALAANPIGAIIMAIVIAVKALKAAFNAVKESIQGNEEAYNALQRVLAPFKALVQVLKNIFDEFVETMVKGVAVIGDLVAAGLKWLGVADATISKEQELNNLRKTYNENNRKWIVENSKLELEASEARRKAYDKETYSAEERKKYLEDYNKKQEEVAKNNLQRVKDELKILETEASLGKNNEEMNNKLAEAKAKVNQEQQRFNELMTTSQKAMTKLNNEIRSEEVAAHNKAAEAAKKHREELQAIAEKYTSVITKVENYYRTEVDIQANALDEEERRDEEHLQKMLQTGQITKEEYNKRLNDLNNYYTERIKKLYDNVSKLQLDFQKKFDEQFLQGNQKALADLKNQFQSMRNEVQQQVSDGIITDEQAEGFFNKITEAENKAIEELKNSQEQQKLFDTILETIEPSQEKVDELKDKIITAFASGKVDEEKTKELLQSLGFDEENITNIITKVKEGMKEAELVETFDELTAAMGAFASTLDGVAGVLGDTMTNTIALIGDMTKAIKEGGKGWGDYAKLAAAGLGMVGNMLNGLAQEEEGQTEKSFKRKQGLEIASAVMNMASGILMAFTTAMELGPIAGPIVGAALSAVIAGLGAAQIAQIKNTKRDGSGGGSSTPSIKESIAYTPMEPIISKETTAQAVGIDQFQTEQQPQRVYVVESDIAAVGKQVEVKESEATF